MGRDELIDRLYAIACQHGDEYVTLDGNTFSVKEICLEAGKVLGSCQTVVMSRDES